MKRSKYIFFVLFTLFLVMPFNVNAENSVINKIDIIVENPEEGNKPAETVDIKMYLNGAEVLKIEDVEVVWEKVAADKTGGTIMGAGDVFEKDNMYAFEYVDGEQDRIIKKVTDENYTVANSGEIYVNGMLVLEDKDYPLGLFYIGGIEYMEVLVNIPIVGEKFPSTYKAVVKICDETKEFILDAIWTELSNNTTLMDEDVAESGKQYMIGFDLLKYPELRDIIINKRDFRSKALINGKEVTYNTSFITPLEANTKYTITNKIENTTLSNSETTIAPNTEYKTIINMQKGYELPEVVYVLIGGRELSKTNYSYNSITGELIIPSERVTGNIILISEIASVNDGKYTVIFDANEGLFKGNKKIFTIDDWKIDDEKNIEKPTRTGYEFIGFFTEKIGGTSLEHYLAEAGIDDDLTFYAQWKKVDTEMVVNPRTSDNIGIYFITGMLSLVILIVLIIYFRKKIKVN